MKKAALWAVLILSMYVFQTSLLPMLSYNGISANLMLLLTMSVAFIKGNRYGVFIGFITGLLQDLTTGSFFGCDIFSYMLIGLLCGKFSNQIFKDQFFLPVITSSFVTLIHYAIIVSFIFMLGYKLNLQWNLQHTLLPMICYQLMLAYPVYKLTFEFNEKLKK